MVDVRGPSVRVCDWPGCERSGATRFVVTRSDAQTFNVDLCPEEHAARLNDILRDAGRLQPRKKGGDVKSYLMYYRTPSTAFWHHPEKVEA